MNGHVNNAVFATYFEAGRVDINRLRTQHLVPPGMSFMLARVAIDYKAEINFPGSVEVATAVARIGKSSITYAQALFFEGHCAATADCISVLVDRATRRSAEIPTDLRAHYESWLVAAR